MNKKAPANHAFRYIPGESLDIQKAAFSLLFNTIRLRLYSSLEIIPGLRAICSEWYIFDDDNVNDKYICTCIKIKINAQTPIKTTR